MRFHEHRRKVVEDVADEVTDGQERQDYTSDSHFYRVHVDVKREWDEKYTRSILRGKDIVLPYELRHQADKRQYASFIIGRDEHGDPVESTCDGSKLDYSAPNAAAYLSLVYFKREVLGKYYAEPTRYYVDAHTLRDGDIWGIDIAIVDDAFVQVYLGDLGRMPYRQQMHWRQYNIEPQGGIPVWRYYRDFMCQFIETTNDPIENFRRALDSLKQTTDDAFGEALIKDLHAKDTHAYAALHLPVTEEHREIDEQVQYLAKVVCDSLNVSKMERESGKKINEDGIKGSIQLLGAFLAAIGATPDEQSQIVGALSVVQSLRSQGVAHRKGRDYDKTLEKYGLAGQSNQDTFEKVIRDTTVALCNINAVIDRRRKANP